MTARAGEEHDHGRGAARTKQPRPSAWLAWSIWALCVVLFATTLLLLFLTPPIATKPKPTPEALTVLLRVMALSFPTVGAFVASRRPKNSIGWIFCATGLLTSVRSFAEAYADYALGARAGSLPGGEYMAWIASLLGAPVVALAVPLVLLVFPDGKLLGRLWWIVVWVAAVGAALFTLDVAFWPWLEWTYGSVDNPLGVTKDVAITFIAPLSEYGMLLLIVSWVGAAVALIVRVEGASRVERQQIKWLVYAAALMGVSFGAAVAGGRIWDPIWVFFLLGIAAFNCFPIAVGIAILRYRLYDIDVVINRTLVYGSLTAMLVGTYFGSVVLLQRLLVVLTGQKSTLAVVASTLVIAALFNPLRRRIQSFIDRRFYRRKYDARKTLEAFSAKLRDETDLDALSADLVSVVRETMQPAHVSLWLRPYTPPKGQEAD
jgi:hypothetical protein